MWLVTGVRSLGANVFYAKHIRYANLESGAMPSVGLQHSQVATTQQTRASQRGFETQMSWAISCRAESLAFLLPSVVAPSLSLLG